MNEKILIIEDDTSLIDMLRLRLEGKGFDILTANGGRDGLRMAYDHHPNLVILDIMMPDMDGYIVCQRLREMSDVPILMLTAKTEEEDVVRGFQVGADDYVKKPFSLWELEERLGAILKRARTEEQATTNYDDGSLKIDLDRQQVCRNGKPIHLTPTEFRLLSCLVRKQGSVVSHDDLLADVWGPGYRDATDSLSVYVHYLRDKLEDDAGDYRYIRSRWGVGYWFAARNQNHK